MEDLYKTIESLCAEKGLNVTELCKRANVSRSALSDFKTGRKKSISAENLQKLANTLEVDVNTFSDKQHYYCLLCGLEFDDSDEEAARIHWERHENWAKAVKKFGFCWQYRVREPIKATARNKIDDGGLTLEEHIEAQIQVFKALFSRSLETSNYRLDHVDFPTYVSMMLFQEQQQKEIPAEVYSEMKKRFGAQPGIPTGTYYQPYVAKGYQRPKKIRKKAASSISDEALKLAKDYDNLDGHGQRVVRLVADEEKARCASAAEAARRDQMEAGEMVEIIRFSVPGYSMPLSAGTGQEAGQEYPENYTLVKEPPRGTSFIARVSGDSMEPTYHDGDLVFVHSTEEIQAGKIGAFHMDGQQWVKELGDGVLISHNPEYAPRAMTEDIRCQGLVLGVCDESYFE